MKWSKTGLYEETDSKYALHDPESERYFIFYLNQEARLIIRSMFEEDVKPVMVQHNQSNSQKRKLIKVMSDDLPIRGSEYSYFVVERVTTDVKESSYDDEHNLISYESKIIGFATRKNNNFFLCLNKLEIGTEKQFLTMFSEIGEFLGLTGGHLRCVCH